MLQIIVRPRNLMLHTTAIFEMKLIFHVFLVNFESVLHISLK